MRDIILFMSGIVLGGLVMWLWMKSRLAWKDARNLMQAPGKARAQRAEQAKKARASASKGRRQMFWSSIFFFMMLAVIVVLLAVLIFNL